MPGIVIAECDILHPQHRPRAIGRLAEVEADAPALARLLYALVGALIVRKLMLARLGRPRHLPGPRRMRIDLRVALEALDIDRDARDIVLLIPPARQLADALGRARGGVVAIRSGIAGQL